ncbi:hypothetical protein B0H17DRAFT_1204306 [Mycena rosella]|uniref:Uncharacterized protein n=1 Tax=Mycena rosella TaxID=1033263 RepID=A0AAD7DB72_MYCRO|nr:hypothetical protein B0H17DRAFT_1204306 [Mycena rosella]
MPAPTELLSYIDAHTAFIARLAEAVAIPSMSGGPVFRPSGLQMPQWLDTQLQTALPLPNAILGRSKTVRSTGTSKSSPPRWATDVLFSLSLLFVLVLGLSRLCFLACARPAVRTASRLYAAHLPTPTVRRMPRAASTQSSFLLPKTLFFHFLLRQLANAPSQIQVLMRRMRLPSLSLHRIECVGKPWYSVRSRLSILFLVMFLPAFPYIDPHRTPSISFPMHVLFTLARRPHLAPLCLHTSHTIAVVPFYSLCIPPVHALPSIRVVPLRLPIGRSTHPRPVSSPNLPDLPLFPSLSSSAPSLPVFVRIPSASSSPPLVLSWLLRPRPPKPMPAPPRTLSRPPVPFSAPTPAPHSALYPRLPRASHRRLFPRPTSRIPPHAAFLSIPFSISPSRHSVAAD